MATAREILLAEETDSTLVIDLERRVIDIPPTIKHLGVESDKKVKRLNFRVPATYGDVDLSEFDIRINYFNAKTQGDVYPVTDKAVTDDGNITFSWEVDDFVVRYKGTVKFIACFRLLGENAETLRELNTTPASLPVLEGLETTSAIINQNPDVIEQMLLRLNNLENFGTVSDEQVAAAVDNYLTLHPIEGVTDEQVAAAVENYLVENPIEDGEDGQNGADGKSAFEYAVEGGYTGTEDEFGAKLAELLTATSAEEASF
jgi:hypothetical protein